VECSKDAEVGAPANGLNEPRGDKGTEKRATEKAKDPEVDAASALVEVEPVQILITTTLKVPREQIMLLRPDRRGMHGVSDSSLSRSTKTATEGVE